jgi:hypothetical protein
MKRYLTMALAGVLALGLGSAALAVECALDVVPASTLLFPFVEYDYAQGAIDDSGQTTLIAITNVSSEAQIVHITLWTDYSIAILDFNLTMTGYDVQTINIRDILRDGNLPSDDTGANEWWDGVAPTNAGPPPFDDGPYSTFNQLWSGSLDTYFSVNGLPIPWSTNPLDCDPLTWVSSPVNYRAPTGTIPAGTLDIFEGYLSASQLAVTGYRNCDWSADVIFPLGTWFTDQEPRATWMYITADVVGACNKDLPDSDALNYFGAASGVRTSNTLVGDLIYLNSGENLSESFNAVHLEANPALVSTPSPLTGAPTSFYHRYHFGATSSPREPLPTAWAVRYMFAQGANADTWIRTWKGSTESGIVVDLDDTDVGPGGVIGSPGPAFLYANSCIPYTYYAWDEDENVNAVGPGFIPPWSGVEDPDPIPVPNLFPLETQEVAASEFFLVADVTIPNAFFGWMMFIWPLSNWDGANPVIDEYDAYQTWMGVKYSAFGQFTAGRDAAVLANYNCDATQILPGLGIGMY